LTRRDSGAQTLFDLTGRVAIITGGAGLLGVKHGEAIAALGGIPVLVDLNEGAAQKRADAIASDFGVNALGVACDITDDAAVKALRERVLETFGRADILINNAANNPKVEDGIGGKNFSRMEDFPIAQWNQDMAVGLTGAFLCARAFGQEMARQGKGVIINIASHYGLVAPNQSLYHVEGAPDDQQPVKSVTYPVVKAGLIGLTRYLATYWPGKVRANTLAPGGVFASQPEEFLLRYAALVPMARMGNPDEFRGAVAFLASDASSYVTGATLMVDGGLTCW
jgi:NAD(P)-dependent dehydrogenase (short-subunit alcohol dehydrogenase family)